MAVCPNCKKILEENEYICSKCYEIIDLEKYENYLDSIIAEMPQEKRDGIIERKKTAKKIVGSIVCDKCGFHTKIENGVCKTCGHIFDLKRFLLYRKELRAAEEENRIYEDNKGMVRLCCFVPLVGLILKRKYKKKDKKLSELCYQCWKKSLVHRWYICGLGIILIGSLFFVL